MKYMIHIDKSTIRKNPHGGNTVFHQLGQPEITWTFCFKDQDMSNIKFTILNGILVSVEPCSNDDIGKVCISENTPIQNFHTISPLPEYLYEYMDLPIQCEYCLERFSYRELREDYDNFSDSFYTNICPRCHSSECCEIEYETLPKNFNLKDLK